MYWDIRTCAPYNIMSIMLLFLKLNKFHSAVKNAVFILTFNSQEVANFVLGCVNFRIFNYKFRILVWVKVL